MSRRFVPSPMPIILIMVAWFSQETEQRTVWILRAAGTVISILLSWAEVSLYYEYVADGASHKQG